MSTMVEGLNTQDVFHVTELFLLSDAIQAKALFGLPDRSLYGMMDRNYLDEAKAKIQEKGILDEAGHLTDGGYLIIKSIEEYAASRKYVQINNLMIAFSELEEDMCIVLTEIEPQEYYILRVIDKYLVMKELFDHLAIVKREPLADETEFVLKKARNRERRSFLDKDIPDNALSLEVYSIEKNEKSAWLCFVEEDKLYSVSVEDESYYRASQYWLMKELFDSLEIPYGAGEQNV
ncbi:DUF5081 family protein [Enterococcus sp. LJL51]|uniref:DUF5081 family protein n=1 Tax=Enterococcus sp. LJL51 TaxID=3416656 RepID=UPI003CEA4947